MALTESQKVMRLVDPTVPTADPAHSTPTVTATQSGKWSDPATWGAVQPPPPPAPSATFGGTPGPNDFSIVLSNMTQAQAQAILAAAVLPPAPPPPPPVGKIPQLDDKVCIPSGITVTLDVDTPRLKWVRYDGNLAVPPGVNILHWAELTVFNMESVWMVDPTARIKFLMADYGPIDYAADPWAKGRAVHFMNEHLPSGVRKDTYVLTKGNAAGDMVIEFQSPVVNWESNDLVVLPDPDFIVNWPNTLVNQDEKMVVDSVAADNMSCTLKAPLKFHHPNVDWEGKPIKMYIGNYTQRSIHFESENKTVFAQRGHVMFMRDGVNMPMMDQSHSDWSIWHSGRTDGTQVVTDPDGAGNGLSNPRGLYGGEHFHICSGDPNTMRAMPTRIVAFDSAKWAFTIHSSHVCFTDCLSVDSQSAAGVAEVGDENGCFDSCVSCRNTILYLTALNNNIGQMAGVADWFKYGHGFGTMTGGVSIQNCIVSGAPNSAYGFMGLPFGKPGVNPVYPAKWLAVPGNCINDRPDGTNVPQTQYANSTAILDPADVPQNHFGNECFSSYTGAFIWNVGQNGVLTPPVAGPHNFQGFHVTFSGINGSVGVAMTYSSNVNVPQAHITPFEPTYLCSGIGNSGVATNQTYDDLYVSGCAIGIESPTAGNCSIKNPTFNDCIVGIHINNVWHDWRSLPITVGPNWFTPPDATTLAGLVKQSAYTREPYVSDFNKNTYAIVCECHMGSADIRESYGTDRSILQFLQGAYIMSTPDEITLNDGVNPTKYLFHKEQALDYVYSAVTNPVPDFMVGKTVAQVWQEAGMLPGAKLLPPDAAPLPGSLCLFSTTDQTAMPDIQVSKHHNAFDPQNYQTTSNPANYVPQYIEGGKTVQLAAMNLNDPGCTLTPLFPDGAGNMRGFAIFCDSKANPPLPSSW